jgi:hypothetical protein
MAQTGSSLVRPQRQPGTLLESENESNVRRLLQVLT